MNDENRDPEVNHDIKDVVSAWLVGTAVICGLLAISYLRDGMFEAAAPMRRTFLAPAADSPVENRPSDAAARFVTQGN